MQIYNNLWTEIFNHLVSASYVIATVLFPPNICKCELYFDSNILRNISGEIVNRQNGDFFTRNNVYEDIIASQVHFIYLAENSQLVNNTFQRINLEYYNIPGSAIVQLKRIMYSANL